MASTPFSVSVSQVQNLQFIRVSSTQILCRICFSASLLLIMEDKASLLPTISNNQKTHQPLKLKKPHHTDDGNMDKKGSFTSTCSFDDTKDPSASKTSLLSKEEIENQNQDSGVVNVREEIVEAEMCGRERLKRHRVEVAGRVWIPEMWGQEELLKEWINCSAFDAPFVPSRIMTARAALVQQGRRALLVD